MDINQYYLNNNGNFVRKNQYGQYFQYYDYNQPPLQYAPIHHHHQHHQPPPPSQYLPTIIEAIHYYDNRNYSTYIQPPIAYPHAPPMPSHIPAPQPHGYLYHQPHHSYRSTNNFQQTQDLPLENLQLVSVSINYKQSPSKSLSNESNDEMRFSSAQSNSSYSTYSSSSSSSSSTQNIINTKNAKAEEVEEKKQEDEDSFIAQSIQRHNIQQLNENFKKLLSKPYNYYLNDSVFSHIHVKPGDISNKNAEDNEDTTNNDNTIDENDNDDNDSDSMSQSSSDTSFSRYAPTDDDEIDFC